MKGDLSGKKRRKSGAGGADIYGVGTDKHGVRTPHTPVMVLGGVILVLLPGGLCACVFVSVFSF